MTVGFEKLLGLCRDNMYEWSEYFGGSTGKGIISGHLLRENEGLAATPLDVAVGIRHSFFYSRGGWSDRCQMLGLTNAESRAAFDAIFSRVHEKDSVGGYLQMSILEYKDYLRCYIQLKKAFGGYDEYDEEAFMYALQSIGLGMKSPPQAHKHRPVYKKHVYK